MGIDVIHLNYELLNWCISTKLVAQHNKSKFTKKRCYFMPLNVHTWHTYSITPLSLSLVGLCLFCLQWDPELASLIGTWRSFLVVGPEDSYLFDGRTRKVSVASYHIYCQTYPEDFHIYCHAWTRTVAHTLSNPERKSTNKGH